MKLLGRLPEMIFSLVIAVVVIQLAIGAIQPYLGWIGRTFAIVVIAVLIAGAAIGTIAAIRVIRKAIREGGGFNK